MVPEIIISWKWTLKCCLNIYRYYWCVYLDCHVRTFSPPRNVTDDFRRDDNSNCSEAQFRKVEWFSTGVHPLSCRHLCGLLDYSDSPEAKFPFLFWGPWRNFSDWNYRNMKFWWERTEVDRRLCVTGGILGLEVVHLHVQGLDQQWLGVRGGGELPQGPLHHQALEGERVAWPVHQQQPGDPVEEDNTNLTMIIKLKY